jgi:hypothetical protein
MLCFVFCLHRIYASRHSRLALQGVEEGSNYLHRSPASRKRRWEGNPVPGRITGPPCSWGIYIRAPGHQIGEVSNLRQLKCGHESCGTQTWVRMRWRRSATIVNDRLILSSERRLHKEYDRRCSIENSSDRESQVARYQDKLIGGKPPVSDSDSDSDSNAVSCQLIASEEKARRLLSNGRQPRS